MCYHKNLVERYDKLMEHYSASFASITAEMDLIKEKFQVLKMRDQKVQPYSKEEVKTLRTYDKILSSFTKDGIERYHENGFDHLPTPIITAGDPENFKMFYWGLIPFYMPTTEKAMKLRVRTLNCISEEMFEKDSFRDAVKNGQRCLIPTTAFYEWRWMDEDGDKKIPYAIYQKERKLFSVAGLYSRWKHKETAEYLYTYTVLTTSANPLMETIHNNKKRMPVIIPEQYEKDWLNPNLTKDDVLALCSPVADEFLNAHTISKRITSKKDETNVPEILNVCEYEELNSK